MRPRLTPVSILGWASLVLCCHDVDARLIESWPYDKLFKHADLVVIVKPVSVRDAKADDKAIPPQDFLVGIVTTLEIQHVIKGDYKEDKLDLVHFKLKEGLGGVINGPLLVSFPTKDQEIGGKDFAGKFARVYMLFLKKGRDGRFEFVSGQFDPELSVKQLLPPLP